MFQITHNLNWIVRKGSELESNIVSVERIREYSEIATEVYKFCFVGNIPGGFRKLLSLVWIIRSTNDRAGAAIFKPPSQRSTLDVLYGPLEIILASQVCEKIGSQHISYINYITQLSTIDTFD